MKITQTIDLDIITRLNQHVQNLHVKLYPDKFNDFDFDAVKLAFQEMLTTGTHELYLVEDSGEPAGFVWIEIISKQANAFKKAEKIAYVHQIVVTGEKQNNGYGSALMKQVEKVAKAHNVQIIELDYWNDNTTAKDFYKKHGFTLRREYVQKKLT